MIWMKSASVIRRIVARQPSPMDNYIAFFTSLAYLSVRAKSRFWQGEEYTVFNPDARNKTLTTVRLRSDQDQNPERRTHPFIVTSKNEKGFQHMMLYSVGGIAYKVNATAPISPVKEQNWINVGAKRTLIVMG
jgi:hypothetical protein